MTSGSPPAPWERSGVTAKTFAAASPLTSVQPNDTLTTSSEPPSLPLRPSTLSSLVNQTASNYSNYNAPRMGGTGYGGYGGGYNSYSSPYSRFGGMGGMGGMGGGMGGGMYGNYGGGMYGGGMGGMYGGGMGAMGGPQGNPNDPNSLTNTFNQSTQATFQIIESIVGAFGGFAQMLESTYMATHSSFFAMVSVAEQFGNLRDSLGSIFGIFTLLRWLRTLLAKVRGRPPPVDATALTPSSFASFLSGNRHTGGRSTPNLITLPDGTVTQGPPRPSKKPFIMFLVAVFGLPYLMGKLIRALARSQETNDLKARQQAQLTGPLTQDTDTLTPAENKPSQLQFCRLLYDYTPPQTTPAISSPLDLTAKKGDLVVVLSKSDPSGAPSDWWKCRARDSRVGYLPSPYLELIPHKPAQAALTQGEGMRSMSASGSRTATLRTVDSGIGSSNGDGQGGGEVGRASSLGSKPSGAVREMEPAVVPEGGSKALGMDVGVEGFQKSTFYS